MVTKRPGAFLGLKKNILRMTSQVEVGFKEAKSTEISGEGNYKLVPWISWDEWFFVKESLFSASPESALRRIYTWRSRGCLPVLIEVTASIVETQQKDSHFREGLSPSDLLEDDMLTMLYCMTIMRLVNGIVEKSRNKNQLNKVSIAKVADVIGIPRMLIDIRHESSHRDLPSLKLARLASTKALDWLKAYYWEPQKMAIPYPSDRTANSVKVIKSKIRKLALSMDVKEVTRSRSPGKRIKKNKNKPLENVLKLYSSFPSEVVSILLKFLLKAQESADVIELSDSSHANNSKADTTQLDDWKPLVMKLSNKEPEMLLSLLKAVVQIIETRETQKYESEEHLKSEHNPGFHQTKHLSSLFKWLVGNLKDLMSSHGKITSIEAVNSPKEKVIPKSSVVHLLRKCLTVSSHGNNHLETAASVLAQTTGNHTFVQKLNKLASLHTPYVDTMNETTLVDRDSFYIQQEKFINQAAKKLEFFKQKLSQNSKLRTVGVTKKKSKGWSVVKSWKSCPIGMLPSDIGSSGVLPILDIVHDQDEQANLECSEKLVVNESHGKREADCPLETLDDSNVKKRKENECIEEDERILEEVNNRLMIGGVWKRITEDEVSNIASSIRILV